MIFYGTDWVLYKNNDTKHRSLLHQSNKKKFKNYRKKLILFSQKYWRKTKRTVSLS